MKFNLYYSQKSTEYNEFLQSLKNQKILRVEWNDFVKYYCCIYCTNNSFSLFPKEFGWLIQPKVQKLNDIYDLFSTNNNPLLTYKYQEIILRNGLHTNISEGDIIDLDSQYYLIGRNAFNEIKINKPKY